ncbi:aminotransferase class I/II-fold pyridoxal phosphate-dependent enzyme [Telmatocola sphagniphila]|uniref:Aminotransferase class I/II-fold pyridoxal phosphate-dependent enzyme n=1 Tax=Telmatocola sphagniphila TaxID=1123043 RepID=A0A8E6BA61_9BACT|nr:GntG family PLP-dependent aldolase [Telmatocola sphagniphila]QVL33393.1 aminotransferase class I/II-fold pyridoxal phosphate-dependent enzyme [Telmatocola sphagniphila]
MNKIDLRSDTATKPTPGMRAAMANAEVGDDVFGEDPTINKLQERVAELFGKEAGLLVPSGTMSNQICVKAHTQPGDELLCETTCHIYTWEAGGPAVLSGVSCRTLDGDYGILDLAQLEGKIRPANDHYVRTRLVCLENTHNRGGGRVYPIEKIEAISQWAVANGLARHLDGARIWNAIIASGISGKTWASHFDTLSVCFSKGMGTPIGSMLLGSKEFVAKSKRIRKLFGGGMRQAGIIAAAAIYALDNNFHRLEEDHKNAQILVEAINATPGLKLEYPKVETNLVWFEVSDSLGGGKVAFEKLKEQGVWVSQMGPNTLRACTHLDISRDQVIHTAKVLRSLAPKPVPVSA